MSQQRIEQLLEMSRTSQGLTDSEQQELLHLITHSPIKLEMNNKPENEVRVAHAHIEHEKRREPRFVSYLVRPKK